ncbi:MAG: beta-lactamase family protein [Gemmatimonadaceae bacterium]|nr:beta-lactamase family protein [Gemmatimonadaceae bacterium]
MTHATRYPWLLPAILGVSSMASAQPMSRAALVARLDSIASAPVKSGAVAGISVAVVKGRDTLLMKGYGYADVENQLPVTPTTVFRIGSLTKQFTSAAVMQLVEKRTVGLDDNMNTYIPNFPTHGRTIPVRYLLNHTSGIPSYTDIGARFGRVSRLDLAPDSLIAIVANDSLQYEPGTQFYYNNTGYFMLGMVLEKVTGKKYGDHLESSLFKSAGLTQTYYCDARRIIPHRAQGYDRAPTGLVNTDFMSMQLPYAAGSLCSTVGDLVSWTQQLSSGRVVSAASYREMTTPVTFASGRPMTYGYGLGSDTVGGRRVISHGGGINGFISFLSYVPQDSLIIAVLSNTSPAPSSAVADAIMRAVLGIAPAPSPGAPKDLTLTATERARYVGEYALARPDGSRQAVRVFEQGEQLMVEPAGQIAIRLRAQGAHVFVGLDGSRMAFDVAGERATGFMFGTGSRRLEAVRRR